MENANKKISLYLLNTKNVVKNILLLREKYFPTHNLPINKK